MGRFTIFLAEPRRRARRAMTALALTLAAILFALAGLAAASYAGFAFLLPLDGPVIAALAIAGVYGLSSLAIFVFANAAARGDAQSHAELGLGQEPKPDPAMQTASAAGAEFGRSLTPLQAALLAALMGFLAARRK